MDFYWRASTTSICIQAALQLNPSHYTFIGVYPVTLLKWSAIKNGHVKSWFKFYAFSLTKYLVRWTEASKMKSFQHEYANITPWKQHLSTSSSAFSFDSSDRFVLGSACCKALWIYLFRLTVVNGTKLSEPLHGLQGSNLALRPFLAYYLETLICYIYELKGFT